MSDGNRERETTTIVTTDGGGRGGGTAIAVILLIAVLALLFYLFGDSLMGGCGETTKDDVDVAAPTGCGTGSKVVEKPPLLLKGAAAARAQLKLYPRPRFGFASERLPPSRRGMG